MSYIESSSSEWRDTIENALGLERDPINHSPEWAHDIILKIREIGNNTKQALAEAYKLGWNERGEVDATECKKIDDTYNFAYVDAIRAVEFHGKNKRVHICGDPSDPCDMDCMERAAKLEVKR